MEFDVVQKVVAGDSFHYCTHTGDWLVPAQKKHTSPGMFISTSHFITAIVNDNSFWTNNFQMHHSTQATVTYEYLHG